MCMCVCVAQLLIGVCIMLYGRSTVVNSYTNYKRNESRYDKWFTECLLMVPLFLKCALTHTATQPSSMFLGEEEMFSFVVTALMTQRKQCLLLGMDILSYREKECFLSIWQKTEAFSGDSHATQIGHYDIFTEIFSRSF